MTETLSIGELKFLALALEEARRGIALASPNPCVGAVIVDANGSIVGRGSHLYDNRKHAEIVALDEAGLRARGATLYLNLEPCSHTGRTGPCAEAVIRAGIARVVCSMTDPNPQVSGRGFALLHEAGIEVHIGGLEAEARQLNEPFVKFIRTQTPLVTLKGALSLDGRIAPSTTSSLQRERIHLTSEPANHQVQQLRHAADAILVGIGTALADDPQLNDRSGLPRRRPLLRVVLDSQLHLPLTSKLATSCKKDVLLFCSESAPQDKRSALQSLGVQLETLPSAANGRLALDVMLRCLGTRQILSLLVEGGAAVNTEFLAADLADKLWLFITPHILGPAALPWSLHDPAALPLAASKPISMRVYSYEPDAAIEATLHNVYR